MEVTVSGSKTPATPIWLAGGGQLGELIRAKDWSQTPLGAVESWPQSLRTAVSMLLPSRAQIILFWGPDLVGLYNDAYAPVLGLKHPWALGRPAREPGPKSGRMSSGPMFEGVMQSGKPSGQATTPSTSCGSAIRKRTYFDVSYDRRVTSPATWAASIASSRKPPGV
jgi:hypothetical protein